MTRYHDNSQLQEYLRHDQSRAAPIARLILHDNLDVTPEQHQKHHEPIQRKVRELAAFESGDLWLIDFENVGGLGLREFPPPR